MVAAILGADGGELLFELVDFLGLGLEGFGKGANDGHADRAVGAKREKRPLAGLAVNPLLVFGNLVLQFLDGHCLGFFGWFMAWRLLQWILRERGEAHKNFRICTAGKRPATGGPADLLVGCPLSSGRAPE